MEQSVCGLPVAVQTIAMMALVLGSLVLALFALLATQTSPPHLVVAIRLAAFALMGGVVSTVGVWLTSGVSFLFVCAGLPVAFGVLAMAAIRSTRQHVEKHAKD